MAQIDLQSGDECPRQSPPRDAQGISPRAVQGNEKAPASRGWWFGQQRLDGGLLDPALRVLAGQAEQFGGGFEIARLDLIIWIDAVGAGLDQRDGDQVGLDGVEGQ